jgi:predicted MFS family arabinose efflux permease
LPRDLQLFLAATFIFGFSQSIVDSTFNNFLNETFFINNLQRGLLELPRELPGLLTIVVSAILFFLCSRRQAALSNILCAIGILFIGFKFLNLNFKMSYIVAFLGFITVAVLISMMKKDEPVSMRMKFQLRREYKLYYWLTVLYGTRKQLFLTFAPWVLVTVFKQKTEILATLLTIGGVIGIFFKPMLGKAIDKLGERFVLTTEAAILVFVCLGYGFSKSIFSETTAMFIVFACYILDQMLIAVSMAWATYLQKIAVKPEDVTQTLTMGVSIDHIFPIFLAVLGGFIWIKWGYQYVFLLGAIIAVINFVSALQIKTKPHN